MILYNDMVKSLSDYICLFFEQKMNHDIGYKNDVKINVMS